MTSERVNDLLDQLTVDERAALTAGSDSWHTTPIERLGIGRLKVTDGPTGARGDLESGERAACFPVGVALGASWDVDLLAEVGAALAVEARDKGAHVLLGPTVNLQRTPLAGRHFECYSEDPWLTGALATAWIRGLQGHGVGASIKHLVANDSEFERHTISSEVDEVTLREVLLRPFQLAVADADPWTVMAAYNRIGGTYACEHRWLLDEVLRQEWGWPGLVVSDWVAVQSTVATAEAGCDLEMPGPGVHLGARLAEAVRGGELDEATLDARARTVLHLLERAGVLDDPTEPAEAGPDRPEHRALARRAAVAGTVLLRNEPAGDAAEPLLPLDATSLRRVALIGPTSGQLTFQGGGSSQVVSHRVAALPAALSARLGDGVEVVHEPGCLVHRFLPELPAERWLPDADGRVADLAWFASPEPGDEPSSTRRVRFVGTRFFAVPDGLDPERASCRYTATLVPATTGAHQLSLVASGRARLAVDGAPVVDAWSEPRPGDWLFGFGFAEEIGTVELTEGRSVEITVDYAPWGDGRPNGLRVGLLPPVPDDLMGRAEAAAAEADVAVVVVGTTEEFESEGHDRQTMDLPGDQDELVRRVAAANPATVVLVNAGAPVSMPWADEVPSVAQIWFPGMEGASAVTGVLVGDDEPGGRLPHTLPVRADDGPAFADTPDSYPGTDGHVRYVEGVLLGHRGYAAAGVEPRFCFGHGLGYTSWELDDARAVATPDGGAAVTVEVINTGHRDGTEVVQVYRVEPDRPEVAGALVGFARVHVGAGQRERATVAVDGRALQTWEPGTGWVDPTLPLTLHVGRSSRDLRASVVVAPESAS